MATLQLNLVKKWFDLTIQGVKKEEYREITPYWATRLLCMEDGESLKKYYSPPIIEQICKSLKSGINYSSTDEIMSKLHLQFKKYHKTDFKNGYKPLEIVPRFIIENKKITIGKGNPNWGFTGDCNMFIIHHGIIIEQHNIKDFI